MEVGGGAGGGRYEMLPCLKSRANTPREHFFICLLASRRTRTHTHTVPPFAIMRQHLHNSLLSSRAPEAKLRANIPTRDPVNGVEVNEGVFVLGSAASEVVAPPDSHRLIYSFVCL